jgi:hypothetical protein
VDNAS